MTSTNYIADHFGVDSIQESYAKFSKIEDLADLMCVRRSTLLSILRYKEKHYRTFRIKKRLGGMRTIHAPRTFLKVFQAYFYHAFLADLEFSPSVHGFLQNSSFVTNAKVHINSKHALNLDIKDFFPSCTEDKVRTALEEAFEFQDPFLSDLVSLLTYEGSLPQGSPASPAISNLILRAFDVEMIALSRKFDAKYTRYADDLTFSSSSKLPIELKDRVVSSLSAVGFKINEKKSRFMSSQSGIEVTGLTINHQVNLTKKYRNRIRGLFHRATKYPQDHLNKRNEILGHIAYLKPFASVYPSLYKDGMSALKSISRSHTS